MRTLTALALIAFATPVLAATAHAASDIGAAEIEVTDPDGIALVAAIDDAVDAATETIGSCREAGGALNDCLCANLSGLDRVRDALKAALAAHPEWTGKALFVSDIGDGQSLTIWLDTAARMVEPPDCG